MAELSLYPPPITVFPSALIPTAIPCEVSPTPPVPTSLACSSQVPLLFVNIQAEPTPEPSFGPPITTVLPSALMPTELPKPGEVSE